MTCLLCCVLILDKIKKKAVRFKKKSNLNLLNLTTLLATIEDEENWQTQADKYKATVQTRQPILAQSPVTFPLP